VEFRALGILDVELDFEEYLPGFREKGRVRILGQTEESEMFVYCSDGAKQS